jgi:hypothetical protein
VLSTGACAFGSTPASGTVNPISARFRAGGNVTRTWPSAVAGGTFIDEIDPDPPSAMIWYGLIWVPYSRSISLSTAASGDRRALMGSGAPYVTLRSAAIR